LFEEIIDCAAKTDLTAQIILAANFNVQVVSLLLPVLKKWKRSFKNYSSFEAKK